MPQNTLDLFFTELGRALKPLRVALDSPAAFQDFVATLGWELPTPLVEFGDAGTAIQHLVEKLNDLRDATDDDRRSLATMIGKYAALGDALREVFASAATVAQRASHLNEGLSGYPVTDVENNLPIRLLDLLIIRYLERRSCFTYALFMFLGLFEIQPAPTPLGPYQTDRPIYVIRVDRIGTLFSSTASLPADVYGWGTANFDLPKFLSNFGAVLQTLGAYTHVLTLPLLEEARLLNLPALPTGDPMPELVVGLYQDSASSGAVSVDVDVGVTLFGLRQSGNANDAGFAVTPYAEGEARLLLPLSSDPALPLILEFDTALSIEGGIGVFVRPGGVEVKTALDPAGPGISAIEHGRLGLGIRYGTASSAPSPSVPTSIFSLPGGTRIETQELYLRGGGELQPGGTIEGFVEFGLVGGYILVTMAEADGFLANLIPDGIEAHLDVMIGYSPQRGVYFQGSGSLELTLALNLELGPISLDALHLVLGISGDSTTPGALTLEASLDAGGTIGPVAASVERIGVLGTLGMHPGNLGPVDLALAFKPPNGLGLAVDAGPVAGGGFISFDPDAGRYTGVLSLEVYSFSITAIGILDTKLPGGAPGYSFLIIISIEFTPIQLGYGFTLNGVGGLAGINRTMVTDAIQSGLRNHSVDHVLFPPDPIHNAPAIISDLRTVFPPRQGRYVFGPMAIIGWETFIALELGILLEVPEPIRIVLLGQLSAVFPDKDSAVIKLYIDILGILNFEEKKLSFDGALHDSAIAVFPVVGDFAVRLSWGDDATFLMAVGGFNSQFHAPPGFPSLRRLAISWGDGGNPRISLSAYFALTSNTLQFGAAAELLATAGSFSVHGWTAFDALFQFTPFMLTADLSAGMELKDGDTVLCGIHVNAHLTGPGPWHVWGEAAVSLFCTNVSVAFDTTFGPAPAQPLQVTPVEIWPQLQAAIQDPRNWSPAARPAAVAVATLVASTPPRDGSPLIDPLGGAMVHQRVVPLGRRVKLFNGAPPIGVDAFSIDEVNVGGAVVSTSAVVDNFAPALFAQLTDAERLSLPSFEAMDSGVTFGDDSLTLGPAVEADLSYDTLLIDATSRYPLGSFSLPLDHQLAQMRTGAAAQSPLRTSGPRKFSPPPASRALVAIGEESFVVASTDDLSVRRDLTAPTTKGAAAAALTRHLEVNPTDRGKLQIMRSAELASAA